MTRGGWPSALPRPTDWLQRKTMNLPLAFQIPELAQRSLVRSVEPLREPSLEPRTVPLPARPLLELRELRSSQLPVQSYGSARVPTRLPEMAQRARPPRVIPQPAGLLPSRRRSVLFLHLPRMRKSLFAAPTSRFSSSAPALPRTPSRANPSLGRLLRLRLLPSRRPRRASTIQCSLPLLPLRSHLTCRPNSNRAPAAAAPW